ncbi:hypothetical protein MHBO_000100 [Bonamia ostreae]|uniref:THAP-type domain-containing protein n=1 Tax=Bonamia ostreae TaxID=126728 RepID=A0ABV2AED5_9EUKA
MEYLKILASGGGNFVKEERKINCKAVTFIKNNFDESTLLKWSELISDPLLLNCKDTKYERKILDIENKFENVFLRTNDIPRMPPLEMVIRLGMATIFTKRCKPAKNATCLVCSIMGSFSRAPKRNFKFKNSVLFCSITREELTESNYAMQLPTNKVCGENWIRKQNRATQNSLNLQNCKRLFIVL